MYLTSSQLLDVSNELKPRQDGSPQPPTTSQTPTADQPASTSQPSWGIAIAIVVAIIVTGTAAYVTYACLRRLRLAGKKPTYVPGAYLKRQWGRWKPKNHYASVENGDLSSVHETEQHANGVAAGVAVDRRASVRSVMTLPPYSYTPKETEEIIGREGERGGMDTVIEFPEAADEEEARREDEMESLYQIRLQRRQEIAEREERRRARREAREAGDYARLDQLRQEARQRRDERTNNSNTDVTAETMIAEHNSRGRDRRVSEVTYASLGQVRHDGSRLRAHSNTEDESGGLLRGAAPMGSTTDRHARQTSDAPSLSSINELDVPSSGRMRSHSGATSVSSMGSSLEEISTNETRTHTSNTIAPPNLNLQTTTSGTGDGVDLADVRPSPVFIAPGFSPTGPPRYSTHEWPDAPRYEDLSRRQSLASRHNRDTRRWSGISAPRLPSMNLETMSFSLTPPSQPNSPAVGRGERISEDSEGESHSRHVR